MANQRKNGLNPMFYHGQRRKTRLKIKKNGMRNMDMILTEKGSK